MGSSKIYVAGHTGLIGSALLKKLTEKDYGNVVVRSHKALELKDTKQVNDFFAREKRPFKSVLKIIFKIFMFIKKLPPTFALPFLLATFVLQNPILNSQ